MTAPTTRAELVEWGARTLYEECERPVDSPPAWDKLHPGLQDLYRRAFRHLLAALDTFAVVCPRYPTPEIRNGFMSAGGKQDPEPVMHEFYSWYGDFGNFAAAWRYGTAASPFAPKEPTDG